MELVIQELAAMRDELKPWAIILKEEREEQNVKRVLLIPQTFINYLPNQGL